jgi:hypothetical protein
MTNALELEPPKCDRRSAYDHEGSVTRLAALADMDSDIF